jgi:DNA polymerase-1
LPAYPWLKPLLQVHDELIFEVPESRVTDSIAYIKECMEAIPFDGFDIPIIAEASVGTNYGEMKEWEREK